MNFLIDGEESVRQTRSWKKPLCHGAMQEKKRKRRGDDNSSTPPTKQVKIDDTFTEEELVELIQLVSEQNPFHESYPAIKQLFKKLQLLLVEKLTHDNCGKLSALAKKHTA